MTDPTPKNLKDISARETKLSQGTELSATYETPSLSLAAYLMMNNMELLSAKRSTRRDQNGPEYEFLFKDPELRGPELAVAYMSSESARFDDCTRRLRTFLNAGRAKKR